VITIDLMPQDNSPFKSWRQRILPQALEHDQDDDHRSTDDHRGRFKNDIIGPCAEVPKYCTLRRGGVHWSVVWNLLLELFFCAVKKPPFIATARATPGT